MYFNIHIQLNYNKRLYLTPQTLSFESINTNTNIYTTATTINTNNYNNANNHSKTNRGTYYDPSDVFCGKYDCYKILGFDHLTWGTSPPNKKDITQSYRTLSKRWHPDKNNDSGAEKRFMVRIVYYCGCTCIRCSCYCRCCLSFQFCFGLDKVALGHYSQRGTVLLYIHMYCFCLKWSMLSLFWMCQIFFTSTSTTRTNLLDCTTLYCASLSYYSTENKQSIQNPNLQIKAQRIWLLARPLRRILLQIRFRHVQLCTQDRHRLCNHHSPHRILSIYLVRAEK